MTIAPSQLDLSGIRIRQLPDRQALTNFRCGVSEIDRWVRAKCAKLHERRRARVFCAFNRDSKIAAGFYALSLRPESDSNLDSEDSGWKHRSGFIPLVYLEYIAVRDSLQNQGVGTFLFFNALTRAYHVANNVAVYGVALRSLTERTTATYVKRGFTIKETDAEFPLMIMPIWLLADLIEKTPAKTTAATGEASCMAPLVAAD